MCVWGLKICKCLQNSLCAILGRETVADSQKNLHMEKDREEESGSKMSGAGTTQKTTNENSSQGSKKTKLDISPDDKKAQEEKDANVETGQKKGEENGKLEIARGSGKEQGLNGQKRTEQNQGPVNKSKLEQMKEEHGKEVSQVSGGERNNSRTPSEAVCWQRSFSDVTRQGPLSLEPTMQRPSKQVKTFNNVYITWFTYRYIEYKCNRKVTKN